VLVLVFGRSDSFTAARAAELLKEAGAQFAGAVVICQSARTARSLWL
jgi:hypothetical protein